VTEGEEFVGLVTRSDLVTALDIIRSGGVIREREPARGLGPSPGGVLGGGNSRL
jgi:hypothetical protein